MSYFKRKPRRGIMNIPSFVTKQSFIHVTGTTNVVSTITAFQYINSPHNKYIVKLKKPVTL